MLLTKAIQKFYPELVDPVLTRHKSKSHWRGQRNKTIREKAAALLAKPKIKTICRQPTSCKDVFPLLSICDEDLDVWVPKEFAAVEIAVTEAELLNFDIEMTGHCREEYLIDLLDKLIDRVANQLK